MKAIYGLISVAMTVMIVNLEYIGSVLVYRLNPQLWLLGLLLGAGVFYFSILKQQVSNDLLRFGLSFFWPPVLAALGGLTFYRSANGHYEFPSEEFRIWRAKWRWMLRISRTRLWITVCQVVGGVASVVIGSARLVINRLRGIPAGESVKKGASDVA